MSVTQFLGDSSCPFDGEMHAIVLARRMTDINDIADTDRYSDSGDY